MILFKNFLRKRYPEHLQYVNQICSFRVQASETQTQVAFRLNLPQAKNALDDFQTSIHRSQARRRHRHLGRSYSLAKAPSLWNLEKTYYVQKI